MQDAPGVVEDDGTADVATACGRVAVVDWPATPPFTVPGTPGPVLTMTATSAGDSEIVLPWEAFR